MKSSVLSVVIPCFNDGAFLVETLESVIGQQSEEGVILPEIEVLVVDDRSNDSATLAVLRDVQQRWPDVKVVRNAGTKGVSGARNFGIKACRGDWVAFLDADDIWQSDSLVHRWRVVRDHPTADWVAGDWLYWYPERPLAERYKAGRMESAEILSQAFLTGQLQILHRPVSEFIRACLILPSAVMVRKDVFRKVGVFDEVLSPAEDHEMWLRLAMHTDLYFAPQSVFHYRQRPESLSKKVGAPATMEIRIFTRLLANPLVNQYRGEIRKKLALLNLANAYHYQRSKAWWAAFVAAWGVVRWQPFAAVGWRQVVAALVGGFFRST